MSRTLYPRTSKRLLGKHVAEQRFSDYVSMAWHTIEPTTPYLRNWATDAICDHLQAVYTRQIKKLIINVPPGFAKSTMVSVLFPTWVWIHEPTARFLTASYANQLSTRDSLKSRRILESPWYQDKWSDRFELTSDQNTKTRYENNKTGYRIAMSTGSGTTGERGGYLVCLPYEAIIKTNNGNMQIGDIVKNKLSALVASFNLSTNEIEYESITAYETNNSEDRSIMEIETETGNVLECTEDHLIYVKNKGWIRADEIMIDDIVLELK